MIASRVLTDDMQPDGAVELLASILSSLADAGHRLEWYWLGDSRVRLCAQAPHAPIITITLREMTATSARLVCARGRASSPQCPGDLVAMLKGHRRPPTARRKRP